MRISVEPVDTAIPQGSSATYTCTSESGGFGTILFLLLLPGDSQRKATSTIGEEELAGRGIMLDEEEDKLVVPATAENNLTQVWCQEVSFPPVNSDSNTLTVVGGYTVQLQ